MQRIRALQSSGILCYLALEWWYYYYQRRRVARLITSAPPMNIHKNTRAVVVLVQKNGGMQAVLTRVLHLGKTLRHVQHMQTAENVKQMMVGAESSDLHPAHVLRPLLWSIRGALVHATSDGTYSVWSKWVKGTRPIVLRPRRCTTRRSVSVGRYILWKSPTLDRVPPGRTVISCPPSSHCAVCSRSCIGYSRGLGWLPIIYIVARSGPMDLASCSRCNVMGLHTVWTSFDRRCTLTTRGNHHTEQSHQVRCDRHSLLVVPCKRQAIQLCL